MVILSNDAGDSFVLLQLFPQRSLANVVKIAGRQTVQWWDDLESWLRLCGFRWIMTRPETKALARLCSRLGFKPGGIPYETQN